MSDASELLGADRIDLVVLAPAVYYARYDLAFLSAALDAQLAALGTSHGVALTFRFEVLPQGLAQPTFPQGQALLDLLNRRKTL
ncbi:MAG TPA: hypothetical protein VJM34_02715 [Novosphingobium sp.]|nr:hypothetical protein [Novosphingobium sp.]